MAYLPLAIETAAIYTLTAPNGVIAVFNNTADSNYVGMLEEVTGLDSADVRESATDLVEADGGAHGAFYFGRRPITLRGKVFGHPTVAERNRRLDLARRASLALRGDSVLKWTPAGGVEVFVNCRRQQPWRESGGWNKDFQIAMVAESAVIQSTAVKTVAAATASENRGNYPAYPVLTLTGASTNPTVTSSTGVFRTTGLVLAAGESVAFDMLNHTGVFTAGVRNGQSANRYIDFATTAWPYFVGNATTQSFTQSGGALSIAYRDTWA
jgi:hypothetical protein